MGDRFIRDAYRYAEEKHRGQTRAGGDPYINHCVNVAALVAACGGSQEQIAAALMHDLIEDCGVTFDELENEFGTRTALLVSELSDVFTKDAYPDMNRAERKENEALIQAHLHPQAMLIKLCDIIDNGRTIDAKGGEFAELWRKEKDYLLGLIVENNWEEVS